MFRRQLIWKWDFGRKPFHIFLEENLFIFFGKKTYFIFMWKQKQGCLCELFFQSGWGLGHPFTANLCRFFLIFPHIFSHIFSNIFFFFTNHIFLFDKSHFSLVKHICFCWIIFVSWTNYICGRILDRQIGANCGSADFFAPYV